jgi:GntP family gluconate:H+ symporter
MLVVYLLVCVALIVVFTSRYAIHPFVVLLLVALLYGFLAGMPLDVIIAAVNEGFGRTLGGIGLIIILGVIIGAFLENTGGAYTLAQGTLKIFGKKNVVPTMGVMGYVVSIPVFADSGFMLLSALKKSLCKNAGISVAGATIALSLGLTVSHTLIPPTPGPIAAAALLNADLGWVLIVGIPISLVALVVSILFALYVGRRFYIDPCPEHTEEDLTARAKAAPGAFHSTLPIIVPIVLILAKALLKVFDLPKSTWVDLVMFIGEPFVALLIGVLLAFTLPKKLDRAMFSNDGWIGTALVSCASIILITGAGGIFGNVLQKSGIADIIGSVVTEWSLGIWLPFLLAAAIKSAQGSSTVALITAASIMAPLMETLGFVSEFDKALMVIALGAGSAVVSHANDSFFWVVTQMSGMDVRTGYRTHTLGTLVMGSSAALAVFITHLIFS